MKHSFFLSFIAVVLGSLMVSCSSEFVEETNILEQSIQKLHVSIDEILPGDAETRAYLEYSEIDGKRKFDFKWSADDVLGVFPNVGAQAFFPIGEEFAGSNVADFDGGGWALRTGYYYSLVILPLSCKLPLADNYIFYNKTCYYRYGGKCCQYTTDY